MEVPGHLAHSGLEIDGGGAKMSRIRPQIALPALVGWVLLGWGPAAQASNLAKGDSDPALTVRLYAIDPEAAPHLPRAVEEADLVFQKAGLEVHWMDCSPGSPDFACEEAPGRRDIRLRILPGKGDPELSDALGYALPLERGEGVYATVLFGAVTEVRRGTRVSTAQVLGHVIAHEVGHLLLENVHHSRNGLMSANWDHKDLQRIGRRDMRFTDAQTRRIRDRARMRMLPDTEDATITVAVLTPPANRVSKP